MSRSVPVRVASWWLLATGLVGSCWLTSGCSGTHEPAQRSPETARPLAEIKPTADVPALLGKPIEGLRQRLGVAQPLPQAFANPEQYADLAPHATDSVMVFRTGGLLLVASYNIHSRHVNDLLLLGRHEDSLMHRATLRTDAPGYLVIPVFRSNKPGALLGLRVVPTNRD